MKKILIVFLALISLSVKAQENTNVNYTQNGKIYYNPNLSYWNDNQYTIIEVGLKQNVGLNFYKSDLLNYLQSKGISSDKLNTIYTQIDYVETAYPFFDNPILKKVVFLFSKNNNLANLLKVETDYFENPIVYSKPKASYIPNDYNKLNHNEPCDGRSINSYTHLELIKAPEAWNLSKGDKRINLGIIDEGIDPNHIDLKDNLIVLSNNTTDPRHGTLVASCMVAKNDNSIGISSIAGFNNRAFFHDWTGNSVQRMQQMKVNNKVRVVNNSWYNSCGPSPFQNVAYDDLRFKYGLLVVFAAGNGTCGGANNFVFPPSFNNILNVSGVGHRDPIYTNLYYDPPSPAPKCQRICWKDVHNFVNFVPYQSQQHNSTVDVVAPSMYISVCEPNNGYSHYGNGTSFAAPIVTGLTGLILSINPCLTPDEVESIVKNSADNVYSIIENQPYVGLLGSGRINAEKALLETIRLGTNFQQNVTYTGVNNFWGATKIYSGYLVNSSLTPGFVKVSNNSKVTYEANYGIELSAGFEVDLNGKFEIIPRDSNCY